MRLAWWQVVARNTPLFLSNHVNLNGPVAIQYMKRTADDQDHGLLFCIAVLCVDNRLFDAKYGLHQAVVVWVYAVKTSCGSESSRTKYCLRKSRRDLDPNDINRGGNPGFSFLTLGRCGVNNTSGPKFRCIPLFRPGSQNKAETLALVRSERE